MHLVTHDSPAPCDLCAPQPRDFRILDPVLGSTYPDCILTRERAIVVNMQHVQVIIASSFVLINLSEPARVQVRAGECGCAWRRQGREGV